MTLVTSFTPSKEIGCIPAENLMKHGKDVLMKAKDHTRQNVAPFPVSRGRNL